MRDVMRSLACVLALAVALAGCAGLTAKQEAGWTAFHECQRSSPSAALEDLLEGGRVAYRTQEGGEFGSMKACMEQRGYDCDIGVTAGGRRLYTHCVPKTS
jgi:hypothetical protein